MSPGTLAPLLLVAGMLSSVGPGPGWQRYVEDEVRGVGPHMAPPTDEEVRAWDRAHGWSAEPGWQRLYALGAYASTRDPAARRTPSAGEDLVRYTGDLFLAQAVDDAPLRCDHPTRYRFLAERLRDVGAHVPLEQVDCPTFEAWIRPERVRAVEVVFAAASTVRPASFWGHLMLAVRYHPDAAVPPGLEPYFHVAAERGTASQPTFAWRALTGKVPARLYLTPHHRVLRVYTLHDSRTLARFELNLTPRQRRHLLERLWETHRAETRWGYTFARRNCATLLAEIIWSADTISPRARLPAGPLFPTLVLDALAGGTGSGTRLTPIAHDPSAADRARRGLLARARAGEQLALRASGAGRSSNEVNAVLQSAASVSPDERRDGYRAIAAWGTTDASLRAPAAAFLRASVEVEGQDYWAQRRRRGRPGATVHANMGAAGGSRAGSEALLIEVAALAGQVQAALGPRPSGGARDSPQRHDDDRSGFGSAHEEGTHRWTRPADSGAHHLQVWAGATAGRRSWRPAFGVAAALLRESPGEFRERGFAAHAGMRVLDGDVRAHVARDGLRLDHARVTVLGFGTLTGTRRHAPGRRGRGYAFGLSAQAAPETHLDGVIELSAGPVWTLWEQGEFASYLSVTLQPAVGVAWLPGESGAASAAIRTTLTARLQSVPTRLDVFQARLDVEPRILSSGATRAAVRVRLSRPWTLRARSEGTFWRLEPGASATLWRQSGARSMDWAADLGVALSFP